MRVPGIVTALLCVLILTTSARAATPYTPETLAALLPSQVEMEAATGLTFVATQGLASKDDPVQVGRAFAVGNGSFVSIHLFAQAGGTPPGPVLRGSLEDGSFLHETISSTFNAIDAYEALPALSRDGVAAASFYVLFRGQTYSVVAASFLQGDLYGVVIHSKTSGNDPSVTRAALGLLSLKLPR
jgi:hypothetical protein